MSVTVDIEQKDKSLAFVFHVEDARTSSFVHFFYERATEEDHQEWKNLCEALKTGMDCIIKPGNDSYGYSAVVIRDEEVIFSSTRYGKNSSTSNIYVPKKWCLQPFKKVTDSFEFLY